LPPSAVWDAHLIWAGGLPCSGIVAVSRGSETNADVIKEHWLFDL